MKVKLNLDTLTKVKTFADIASKSNSSITLTDGNMYKVNGKSLLGAMATVEWSEIWCESDVDIYEQIKEFVD